MSPFTVMALILVVIASMAIRSADFIMFSAFGIDTFANLLYAKVMRDGKLNLYRAGRITYPPFLPWLIHYVEKIASVRSLHAVSKLFDLATSLAVFYFSLLVSGNELIALIAMVVYAFSPINIISSYGITTRSVGNFFMTASLLAGYAAVVGIGDFYVMVAAAIASGLFILLTSRIAYKTYFIISVVALILLQMNILYALIPLIAVIAIALCLILTRSGFVADVRGQIFLIQFFRGRKGSGSLIKRVAMVFYYDLWWLAAIPAILAGDNPFLAAWLLTVVALSFLWPWGEGERHIMLGAVPAAILAATYLSQQPVVFLVILAVELIIVGRVTLRLAGGRYLVSLNRSVSLMLKRLAELPGDALVLCLPLEYSAVVALQANKRVLYGESTSREGILFQAEVADASKIQGGVEALYIKYHISNLFIDKNRFPLAGIGTQWEALFEDDRFILLRRKV